MTTSARLRLLLASCALAAAVASAHPASAQPGDKKASAKEAYDRGATAYKNGDYGRAATEFAAADELAPSQAALQAALDAAVEADAAPLGMTLVERAKREPPNEALAASVESARTKFAARGGYIRVPCAGACRVLVDGSEVDGQKRIWTTNGKHKVVRESNGVAEAPIEVDVHPDESVVIPVAATGGSAPSGSKLPPLVFWIGAGVTAVVGVATVALAVDAKSSHSDFVDAGCNDGTGNVLRCVGLRDTGESGASRTNVALVSTLLLGAATTIIGLWFTDWHRSTTSTAARKLQISF